MEVKHSSLSRLEGQHYKIILEKHTTHQEDPECSGKRDDKNSLKGLSKKRIL